MVSSSQILLYPAASQTHQLLTSSRLKVLRQHVHEEVPMGEAHRSRPAASGRRRPAGSTTARLPARRRPCAHGRQDEPLHPSGHRHLRRRLVFQPARQRRRVRTPAAGGGGRPRQRQLRWLQARWPGREGLRRRLHEQRPRPAGQRFGVPRAVAAPRRWDQEPRASGEAVRRQQ